MYLRKLKVEADAEEGERGDRMRFEASTHKSEQSANSSTETWEYTFRCTGTFPLHPERAQIHRAGSATGARVLVPSWVWPDYDCQEYAGLGWESEIIQSKGQAVLLQFVRARTSDGAPFAPEWLRRSATRPVPAYILPDGKPVAPEPSPSASSDDDSDAASEDSPSQPTTPGARHPDTSTEHSEGMEGHAELQERSSSIHFKRPRSSRRRSQTQHFGYEDPAPSSTDLGV